MDPERKLGHIIAYYLSRFDKEGLRNLGFKSDKDAFTKAADSLGIKPNYIKFRRDEFDVVHPFRKGWHKRPITLSISNTINALAELDEPTLREIVEEIIYKRKKSDASEDIDQLIRVLPFQSDKKKSKQYTYIPRGITGKKAEDEFMRKFENGELPFTRNGKLYDNREMGCGYDFKIVSEKLTYFIEIKGLAAEAGGIMFTNKEWATAKEKGEEYYLVIVSNIDKKPKIDIVNNPARNINPQKNIFPIIQVSWSVSQKDLKNLLEKSHA